MAPRSNHRWRVRSAHWGEWYAACGADHTATRFPFRTPDCRCEYFDTHAEAMVYATAQADAAAMDSWSQEAPC